MSDFRVVIHRLPSPKLNTNTVSSKGSHWGTYAKAKKEDGEEAFDRARDQRLPKTMPWSDVSVNVHFVIPYVKSITVRDWDNLIGSTKGFWDGLVQAGVLADDNMSVIQRISFSHENKKMPKKGIGAETIFEITQLGA